MTDISYRIVPRGKSGFDVEMDKPDGRKRTVPGFRSEHEADAWIVQAKRMIRDAGPWTPLAPRKPVPAATGDAVKTIPPVQTEAASHPEASSHAGPSSHAGQTAAQAASHRPAAPRVRVRPVRERSEAQG
jgi:hypothetical protein